MSTTKQEMSRTKQGGGRLKIAIVGSGLAALATAISLHQAVEEQQQAAAKHNQAEETRCQEEEAKQQAQEGEGEEEDESATNFNQQPIVSRRRRLRNNAKTVSRVVNNVIIDVAIYERDESFSSRQEGYGLTLTYHPTGLLQQLGVLNDIALCDNPSRSHYILSAGGTILGYFGNAFSNNNNCNNCNKKAKSTTTTSSSSKGSITTSAASSIAARAASAGWGQRGNLRVPRQRVRQVLLEKLESFAEDKNNASSPSLISSQVHWGHKLVDMKHVLVDEPEQDEEEIEGSPCCCCAHNGNNSSSHCCARTRIRPRRRRMIQLDFANGKHAYADIVVGADGIRSTVSRLWIPKAPAPRRLNIRLILGLTSSATSTSTSSSSSSSDVGGGFTGHALVNECGFYTLDIGIRLFVMPYAGNSLAEHEDRELFAGDNFVAVNHDDDSNNTTTCNNNESSHHEGMRFMWQLSFAAGNNDDNNVDNNDDDDDNDMEQPFQQKMTGEELQQEALNLCRDWHAPVQDMIQSTPPSSIWSSHLYDRDPQALAKALLQRHEQEKQGRQHDRHSATAVVDNDCIITSTPSVILVGDALHAMSPFKGQGANQALRDGKTVAKWIIGGNVTSTSSNNKSNNKTSRKKASSPSLSTAASCAMREMVQRTAPVVQASRLAAQYWHSEACWQQQPQPSPSPSPSLGIEAAQSTIDNNKNGTIRFGNNFKFAGVESPEDTQRLLETLRKHDITAETPHLDASIRSVMQNLGMIQEKHDDDDKQEPTVSGVSKSESMIIVIPNDIDQDDDDDHSNDDVDKLILAEARAAFDACTRGDLSELRRISWKHAGLLRVAVDGRYGRSCLHHVIMAAVCAATAAAAAADVVSTTNDHDAQQHNNDITATCTTTAAAATTTTKTASIRTFCTLARWLVTEAGCSIQQQDFAGNTPLDLFQAMTTIAASAAEDTKDTDCKVIMTKAAAAAVTAPLEQVLQELMTRQFEKVATAMMEQASAQEATSLLFLSPLGIWVS